MSGGLGHCAFPATAIALHGGAGPGSGHEWVGGTPSESGHGGASDSPSSKRDALRALFPPWTPVPCAPRLLEVTPTAYGARHLVEYAVSASERVKAYLLLPAAAVADPTVRRPAILASHQHADEYWWVAP
jgi:hypothetical protein